MPKKLPLSFYERDDVVQISRDLIGMKLCTHIDGVHTSGIIVETEAYNGRTDAACHAFPDVRTKRTETLYGPPGQAYIYLCYGIHHLFNIVTNEEGKADAILIRAIEPTLGVKNMLDRRGIEKLKPQVTNGPGKLSQALGITTKLDKTKLCGDTIWVERGDANITEQEIEASQRVGVDYAGEDAKLPWRFTLKGSKWLST
ncbi:MAG TPA: DNA-3-methyladenine glycosylase [Balneolaceae bacterium]|nr:DNA-3-methyladenine glycosylase [Balneolaceae bacterium]